nr:RibD C-terminal domain protein [uncultured bacterium]
MAMSMDGKIATKSRGPVKLGSEYDSRRMAEIRAEHDAVINGASTFRAYPKPLHVVGEDLLAARQARGQAEQPISAMVSSRLDIPRGTDWENALSAPRWAFCGAGAEGATVASLRANGVTVVQTPGARPSPKEILEAFRAAGIKSLLLEGGGEFNASFLEQGLVDVIHLTLVPIVVGGAESPTWCEGVGFPKGKFPRFELAECRNVEGELYLTYRRQG